MNQNIKLNQLKKLLKGCVTITDSNIFALYKDVLPDDTFVLDVSLKPGKNDEFQSDIFSNLQSGERLKSFKYVEKIVRELLARGAGRGTVLAAVGGGVIGDLVGFASSIFMRGVDWICVPTTVTAVADSSIGGKTAINCGAKNSVGAFHTPQNVYFCPEFLLTLPESEVKNGMAEVYKTALLDKKLFRLVQDFTFDKNNSNSVGLDKMFTNRARQGIVDNSILPDLSEILSRCAFVKKRIVKKDYFDRGKRRWLNMGHTVGHALEFEYGLGHGEAVMAGLLAESRMCAAASDEVLEFIRRVSLPYLLSASSVSDWDGARLAGAAAHDKKNNGEIVIAAAKRIGKAEIFKFSKEEFSSRLNSFLSELRFSFVKLSKHED